MCLYWTEKSLLPSFSFSLSTSFVPDLGLPGGLTGRWKRLHRNNKPWEESMRETERIQRRRRRKLDPLSAHGPAHVSIRPTDQRLCLFPSPWWLRPTSHRQESYQECAFSPKISDSFPSGVTSLVMVWLDSACRCFTLWVADLKRGTLFKNKISMTGSCVFFCSVLWSGSDSSPVSRPLSPQSQCA